MLEKFFPDTLEESAYVVDYESLYRDGYRGLIFDIDNTLVRHGAPADKRALELFSRLREIGFGCCLLSNNGPTRASSFAEQVQVPSIADAKKPSIRGYQKAMVKMGTDERTTIFVGDQLFTDIFGARRAGVRNILVKPVHPNDKEIQIKIKRFFERIVLFFYQRKIKQMLP